MARTKGKPVALPTIVRSLDYRGGLIAKMSDGTTQAIITVKTETGADEYRDTVHGRREGQAFIDDVLLKTKSRRTKGVPIKAVKRKPPSGPFGGYMKDPPIDCQYIVTDKEKQEWVECYFCAYKCVKRLTCPCALLHAEGRTARIKALAGGARGGVIEEASK